jgi:hypothetical protein
VIQWVKHEPSDKIWWKDDPNDVGTFIFSFNKKDEIVLFRDYPYKLTEKQKRQFAKENPEWVEFFADRLK